MEKFCVIFCIVSLCFQISNTFILPLKKPDGTLDAEHVVGHVTLLEQMITTLQQTVIGQGKDIKVLTTEIASLKVTHANADTKISDLQKQIGNVQVAAEVTSLKDEITAAKTEIRLVSNEAISLSSQLNNVTHNVQALSKGATSSGAIRDAELKALDQKYVALSTKVNSTAAAGDAELKTLNQKYQKLSSQVNSSHVARDVELKALNQKYQTLFLQVNSTRAASDAELKALDQKYQTLFLQVNSTHAERDTRIKALDQKYQTLSSQVNSSEATRDVELKALDKKYQTLSSQVNSTRTQRDMELKALNQKYQSLSHADKNMTVIVDDVQATLTRVLTEVHSAQTDRSLLHSDVTRLNKSITDTTMNLSAKISEQHTEVGFESWITSSTVTNGMTLKFGNIQYNSGGGYSASTGEFTAPVSGTYLFWTQVRKYSGSYLQLFISKTGTDLGYFNSPTAGYVTGSVITSAHLAAGQQVYVWIYGAQRISTGFASRFEGILLYRH